MELPEEERPEVVNEDNSSNEEVASNAPKPVASSGSSRGYGNVATMSSVRDAEEKGDDRGQAYYAGK